MVQALHSIEAWEFSKPDSVIYDRFFLTAHSQEVRKVKGRIKVVKRISINGQMKKKDCYRKVYWDGYGHCFVGTHNARSRHSDIIFLASDK